MMLLCSLWGIGLAGCQRDLMPFNSTIAGLSRPSVALDTSNLDGILDRVRWLEEARYWSQSLIQAHGLSRSLGPSTTIPLAPACHSSVGGSGCNACLSVGSVPVFGVDERQGAIGMKCWTGEYLQGEITMEVPSLATEEGEGYEDWQEVGRGDDEKAPFITSQVFMRGSLGFRATLRRRNFEATHSDLLWVAGLWIREGDSGQPERRLDGAMGFVYQARTEPPKVSRSAIFLDERSVLYQNPSRNADTYSVEVLGSNGHFFCRFIPKTSGCCQKASYPANAEPCDEVPDQRIPLSWPG
ncbi:MAG: hypothetical protein H6728_15825 [Myxococcales bacterium]|nr:hypothetical protein [Myxococcales bacterium]